MKKTRILFAILIMIYGIMPARAAEFFGPDPHSSPSIFHYGRAGFFTGGFVGASAGYLQHLNSRDRNDIWRYCAYGAIAGAGLGLGLGIMDASHGRTGIGGIVLRDVGMGGGLGLLIGTAVGTIMVADSKDAKDLGRAMAWGYLIGAGAGLLFGFYEGPKIVRIAHNTLTERIYIAFNDSGPYYGFRVVRRTF